MKRQLLKQYFGYRDFRKGQADIIDHIMQGQDVLAVMPTSAGKSICYQIPALLLDGITLVISPLISLMQDQVVTLNDMGIRAELINSTLSDVQYRQVIGQIYRQEVRLIYVAPERLSNASFLDTMCQLPISMVAVDEAHCISQWGNDFRPSYQLIANFIQALPKRPIVSAFTATATQRVREDIAYHLNLQSHYELVRGFDRENLFFALEEPQDKFQRVLQLVTEHTIEPTIIYCSTRKDVERLCDKLQQRGIKAGRYHAGLSIEERTHNQHAFQFDELNVMVATNAFGMGIDKSNVRHVIHYSMPKDLESYYQEAGRAGRDGEPAKCTLFYSGRDIMTNLFFIEQGNDPVGKQKLNAMIDYCRTAGCLRAFMLHYFGDNHVPHECEGCSNCTAPVDLVDMTLDAQKILSCVYRMGERYGTTRIAEVLKGSDKKELKDLGLQTLSTFGIMSHHSDAMIKKLIGALVAERYLKVEGTDYPIIKLTESALHVLKGTQRVLIKHTLAQSISKAAVVKSRGNETNKPYDTQLFERLRQLRLHISKAQHVAPFIIFSDATLKSLCRHTPQNDHEFLAISGVGSAKLEKYGRAFIDEIQHYLHDLDNSENKEDFER